MVQYIVGQLTRCTPPRTPAASYFTTLLATSRLNSGNCSRRKTNQQLAYIHTNNKKDQKEPPLGTLCTYMTVTHNNFYQGRLAKEARAILNSAPGANLSRLVRFMLSQTNSFDFSPFQNSNIWTQIGPLLSNVYPCGSLGELALEPSCGGRAVLQCFFCLFFLQCFFNVLRW